MLEAVDLGTENDERMARLREALALGDGFQLVIVQVEPGESRAEVLQRLQGWSGRHGVPALKLVRLGPDDSPVMRLTDERAGAGASAGAGAGAGVVLIGLEADGPDRDERMRAMLTELNWSRDRLPELVRGPLVLVVSQRVQTALFEQAPDFYSWRMHTTSIAPQLPGPERTPERFEAEVEDPAVLEEMIVAASALQPPPFRELGRLQVRLAQARHAQGEERAADTAFEAAEHAYARGGTVDDRVRLLMRRIDVEIGRRRYKRAAAWLDRAREEVRSEAPSAFVQARLLLLGATLSRLMNDGPRTAADIAQAVDACHQLGDVETEIALLMLQVSITGSGEETIQLVERALELSRRSTDAAAESKMLRILALALEAEGRGDEAERRAQDAVARAQASGATDVLAEARATLAWIALRHDHLSLAEHTLREVVDPKDIRIAAELAEVRGDLALRHGDAGNAERQLRTALEIHRRVGGPWRVAEVSLKLGELGRRTRNWTLALVGFEAADRLGEARQRAAAAFGLANIAFHQGDRTTALAERFADATRQLTDTGNAALADAARAGRGIVLLELGRRAEALAVLESAAAGFETRGQAALAERVLSVLGVVDTGEAPAQDPTTTLPARGGAQPESSSDVRDPVSRSSEPRGPSAPARSVPDLDASDHGPIQDREGNSADPAGAPGAVSGGAKR